MLTGPGLVSLPILCWTCPEKQGDMFKVSRISGSQESSLGQSGSKACVLSIPAPDLSGQWDRLGLGVRGQATEPQGWLCEGRGLTGEEEGWAGGQETGVMISWAPQGSLHSWPQSSSLHQNLRAPVSLSCRLLGSQVGGCSVGAVLVQTLY